MGYARIQFISENILTRYTAVCGRVYIVSITSVPGPELAALELPVKRYEY